MTKLLAFGDLHCGAGADYGREPGDRLRDQRDVLAMIVQLANENHVDAVLFAGDAFHRRRPTPAEMLAWADPLRDLEAPLVAIAGNHDVEAADAPIALDVLAHTARLSKRPEVLYVAGVAVATLPWAPVSRLVASRNGGDRDGTHEDAAALLVAAARGLHAQIPTGQPAVLMLHWSISGASTPTGAVTDDFREVVLPLDELEQLGFDAVVAGHIHKPQMLSPGVLNVNGIGSHVVEHACPILYTGSPAPVDFGEAASGHGVWLLDLNGEKRVTWMPIDSRPFVTVDVDLTTDRHEELGCDETDAVAAAIAASYPIEDAVVRVRYRASEEQARRIDWPKLRVLLEQAHRVYSIAGDIVRSERARVDGMDEDLAPLAAVDAWVSANEISTDASGQLVALSHRYLEEVGA